MLYIYKSRLCFSGAAVAVETFVPNYAVQQGKEGGGVMCLYRNDIG